MSKFALREVVPILNTMAFIRQVSEQDAEGILGQVYEDAHRRAERVFNILKLQSLSPPALKASMDLYLAVMFGPSALSRVERESIAVTVSRINDCFY